MTPVTNSRSGTGKGLTKYIESSGIVMRNYRSFFVSTEKVLEMYRERTMKESGKNSALSLA